MNRSLGIAIGAGLASALLFAASTRGAGLALVIAYVTPLPIMIAALGFGQATGLVAAGLATISIAVVLGVLPGIAFALLLGFPAWWLAYLALLARPVTGDPSPAIVSPGAPKPPALLLWYPIGRVVAWGAALVASVILALGAALILHFGGFETTVTLLSSRVQEIVGRGTAEDLTGSTTARHIVQLLPVLTAASAFLMLSLNLWAAARVVQRSGLLGRPWPALPEHLRLPKVAAGVLLLSAALLLGGGAMRVAGGVVVASLGMAFALQGLGTAHALTRGLAARRPILIAIYFITFSLVPSLVALAVLGVVDCLFTLRPAPQAKPTSPTKS